MKYRIVWAVRNEHGLPVVCGAEAKPTTDGRLIGLVSTAVLILWVLMALAQ